MALTATATISLASERSWIVSQCQGGRHTRCSETHVPGGLTRVREKLLERLVSRADPEPARDRRSARGKRDRSRRARLGRSGSRAYRHRLHDRSASRRTASRSPTTLTSTSPSQTSKPAVSGSLRSTQSSRSIHALLSRDKATCERRQPQDHRRDPAVHPRFRPRGRDDDDGARALRRHARALSGSGKSAASALAFGPLRPNRNTSNKNRRTSMHAIRAEKFRVMKG